MVSTTPSNEVEASPRSCVQRGGRLMFMHNRDLNTISDLVQTNDFASLT